MKQNKKHIKASIGVLYKVTKWQIPTATTEDSEERNIQPYPTADIPQLIRCVAGIPY